MWLPPAERDRNADLARKRAATFVDMCRHAAAEEWRQWRHDLQQIDPYLDLIRPPWNEQVEPPLRAGFFQVIRHNPGTWPSLVKIVETPDGQYKDPDSSLFDEIRRMDLWSDRSARERRERESELVRAQERRKAHERSERQGDALERYTAASRLQVPF